MSAPTNSAERPSPYTMTAVKDLTANDLRWLAEGADSHRGAPMVLALDGGEVKLFTGDEATRKGLTPLVSINTPHEAKGLDKVQRNVRIVLKYTDEGGQDQEKALDETIDAVFLTQAAIEKFVLPYYARFKTPQEITELKSELFYDPTCIAAKHASPSVSSGVAGFAPEGKPVQSVLI